MTLPLCTHLFSLPLKTPKKQCPKSSIPTKNDSAVDYPNPDIQHFLLLQKRCSFQVMRLRSENYDYGSPFPKPRILVANVLEENVRLFYWRDDSFIDYESFSKWKEPMLSC